METLTVESFFEKEDPLNNEDYSLDTEAFLFDKKDMILFAERYHEAKSIDEKLFSLTSSAIAGIMSNPNCLPVTQENFENIAEDAVRVAKATLKELDKQLNS